jgi:hypothetical protein
VIIFVTKFLFFFKWINHWRENWTTFGRTENSNAVLLWIVIITAELERKYEKGDRESWLRWSTSKHWWETKSCVHWWYSKKKVKGKKRNDPSIFCESLPLPSGVASLGRAGAQLRWRWLAEQVKVWPYSSSRPAAGWQKGSTFAGGSFLLRLLLPPGMTMLFHSPFFFFVIFHLIIILSSEKYFVTWILTIEFDSRRVDWLSLFFFFLWDGSFKFVRDW